ncbi:hypothetical protein ABZ626_15510 [Streptomyces longispororuber]|uniref:hypothetical protein n=1 Tax=Streptomyces longispororuber TaxID=68230 RepID=UPI0033F36BE2
MIDWTYHRGLTAVRVVGGGISGRPAFEDEARSAEKGHWGARPLVSGRDGQGRPAQAEAPAGSCRRGLEAPRWKLLARRRSALLEAAGAA